MRAEASLPGMGGTRNLRLGRLRIDGEGIGFEEADSLAFEAARGEELRVGVAYDYRELSEAKEHARIRLVAEAPGAPASTFETTIRDHPALDDSRRGFLSVPIRIGGAGPVRVRFRIEADYEAGAWTQKAPDAARSMRHEGEFVVRLA